MLSATIQHQIRTRATWLALSNRNRCLFTTPIINQDEKQDEHKDKPNDKNDTADVTENNSQDQIEMSIQDELKTVSTKLKEVQVIVHL
jgi:hypothetical protein